MAKIQPPHVPGFAYQQAQRIVELKAQIDRLKTSLQLAEGERDILKGQNTELTRLLNAAKQSRRRLVPLVRWGRKAGKDNAENWLRWQGCKSFLHRIASVSVIGTELRAEIVAALGNGKEAENKLRPDVFPAKETVGE